MGNMIGIINASEIEQLAPMPATVAKLAELVADPEVDINQIARVLELDEALTANVLKIANSAQNASINPVKTLREAIIRLGTGQILKIAVGSRTSKAMLSSFPEYQLREHELWRHSVASALAAENLFHYVSRPVPGVSFTAALLHDIGKLLLRRHLIPKAIAAMKSLIEEDEITWDEAEKKILGVTHAEVGGAIARYWKFPDDLTRAIEKHHDPDEQQSDIIDVVHVANMVSKIIGVGIGIEQFNVHASSKAANRLGLSYSELESLSARARIGLAAAEEQMRS